MGNEAEQLLAAEEAVQELLAHLTELSREMEGYSRAKSSLEDAREAVASLATDLKELTHCAAGIIETLGKVGTPEILARLESIGSSSGATGNLASKAAEAVESLRESQASTHAENLESLEAVRTGLRAAMTEIAEQGAAASREQEKRLRAELRRLLIVLVLTLLLAGGALILSIPAVRAMLGG